MPVVFRSGGLRYYFYSNEGRPPEPPHIHIRGNGCDAKVWIAPDIQIADSYASTRANFRLFCALLRTIAT